MLQRLIPSSFFSILLLVASLFVSGVAEANNPPTGNSIPAQTVTVNATTGGDLNLSFSDPDSDTLTYTATSSDTAIATVSVSGSTFTITGVAVGTATITVTATDPGGLSAEESFSITVDPLPDITGSVGEVTDTGSGPSDQGSDGTDATVATDAKVQTQIPDQEVWVGYSRPVDLNNAFSGDSLVYEASSSDTEVATVELVGKTLNLYGQKEGTATITVSAKNSLETTSLSAEQSFSLTVTDRPADSTPSEPDPADAVPGLSSQEVSQLAALLRYDTVIFNELHNGAVDTDDWLELRNVSGIDLSLDGWQLTIRTGSGSVVIPFPTGTVVPAGEVLLLRNTEMAAADTSVSSVVAETFVLPQADFALVLRSPTAFGDIAGNYFQAEGERPETAPTFAVDTAWYRTEPFVFGYRADAWAESRDGLGTPGSRHPSSAADLNNDGVVDILDLVLVASQFGSTDKMADLNNDGTVNIQDLVLVANALGDVAGAPAVGQSTAGFVNSWLRLARQNASSVVETALPEGFSYERGILTLEQLARALMPERTALLANYPNPFNPETWIPYQLAKAADVTVSIYAADGSPVRMLVLGHQDAGMYKSRSQAAYWDGKNAFGESVASGLYFYTLTAGEFTATRRMLILK